MRLLSKIFSAIFFPIIALALFIFLGFATNVFTPPYEFAQEITDLENTQIEIIYLETGIGTNSLGWVDYELVGDVEISVIRVLESNQKEAFVSDFKKVKSYYPFGDPITQIAGGEIIRITYPDGEVELISDFGTANIKNGQIRVQNRSFKEKHFNALIDRYS